MFAKHEYHQGWQKHNGSENEVGMLTLLKVGDGS